VRARTDVAVVVVPLYRATDQRVSLRSCKTLSRAKRPPLNTYGNINVTVVGIGVGEKPGTGAWKATAAATTVMTRAEAGLVFLLEEDEKKRLCRHLEKQRDATSFGFSRRMEAEKEDGDL